MANYRKTYFCICDGQQETMYLAHIAKLLKDFPRKVIDFKCIEGDVLNKKINYVEYDSVALFDHDGRVNRFEDSIELCDKIMRTNKKTGKKKDAKKFFHAYSNLNFDLWLLLHKQDYTKSVIGNDAYVHDVRKTYELPQTADIKNEKVIKTILSQIALEDVKQAIYRAEKIRNTKLPGDGKKIGDTICYDNPDLSIDIFLRMVLVDSGDWKKRGDENAN